MNGSGNDLLRVELDNGKYTLIQSAAGELYALRHSLPWRDLVGDGLVLALGYEVDGLRNRVALLENTLKEFAECDLNEDNCASLEVATKRVQNKARLALKGA